MMKLYLYLAADNIIIKQRRMYLQISDPIAGNEKRIELEGELDKYTQYNEQLKDMLKKMTLGMGLTIEVDGNE